MGDTSVQQMAVIEVTLRTELSQNLHMSGHDEIWVTEQPVSCCESLT